jgi:predicted type IV restriction endonuclease
VNILAKTAEVNRFAADLCAENVQIAGSHRFVRQTKAVNQARFSRAVRAENKRYRFERNFLRRAERLKISEMQCRQHNSTEIFIKTI